jgi:hypothetical protein
MIREIENKEKERMLLPIDREVLEWMNGRSSLLNNTTYLPTSVTP